MSTKAERKRRAEKTARADFDERWGVGYAQGESAAHNDGMLVMLADPEKHWRDEDGRVNGNMSVVSDVAVIWLFHQPEQHIPGVAGLFKERLAQHRTGIVGGLGSEHHEFAKGAVARVFATLTPEQVETAKAATQRLADRLVVAFPSSRINNPPDQAATVEEKIDFFAKKDNTNYQHVQ